MWLIAVGGIRKMDQFQKEVIEDLYNKFKKSPAVLDELVTQHQELSKLNPSSVNTIRIFTVMIGNECEIIGGSFKDGRRRYRYR